MTMQDHNDFIPSTSKRSAWNKGKLIGARPPLRPKHVWSIRTKLQVEGRTRDLAMFNLAIDSKLRLRRTKATLIYRRTGNLRVVQLLLGHTKIESTVRYLGIDVDDALAIAEQVDV
jgi:hypothetical protein